MAKTSPKWRHSAFAAALALGGLVSIAGACGPAAAPALADEWHDNGHGHGHWDHGRHRGHHRDEVVVERRREVIVRDRPVYVTPGYAPPPAYYAPRAYYAPPPRYYQPSFDFFLRLD